MKARSGIRTMGIWGFAQEDTLVTVPFSLLNRILKVPK